jgi:23S rRNA (adenine2503-C2)-methyltransferase
LRAAWWTGSSTKGATISTACEGCRARSPVKSSPAGRITRLTCVDRRASAVDPFVKYLFQAEDGALVETVRIPLERPRFSVCVSSQAGCGLGCAFCETGRLGFTRHLEAWEIVDQVIAVKRDAPADRPVTGVVFPGTG